MKSLILLLISISLLGCSTSEVKSTNASLLVENNCFGELSKTRTEDQILNSPTPWCISKASYPKGAWERRIEGYVLVQYSVFKNGSVGNVKVLESEPKGVFDEVAMASIKASFYVHGSKDYHTQKRRIVFVIPDEYK